MSTPQFYSWDDDGSPGRTLTGNLQNKLKQILVACLVTGYGSKAGAGWTLEHEHANGFTLSSGDNYINIVSNLPGMHSAVTHIYVAESLTDTSAAIIKGANLCSGPYRDGVSGGAGTPRHSFQVGNAFSSTALKWVVVADDKTAVIYCGFGDIYFNQFTLYFGDVVTDADLSNRFLVLGDENVPYGNYGRSFTLSMGFTAPRNLLTGIAEYTEVNAQPFLTRGAVFTNPTNPAGPGLSNLNLQSPRIFVNNGFAGRLRGVAYDDVAALHSYPVYLRALGLSGTDTAGIGKVVTVSGYQYAYAIGYMGGFVMTNNPSFW